MLAFSRLPYEMKEMILDSAGTSDSGTLYRTNKSIAQILMRSGLIPKRIERLIVSETRLLIDSPSTKITIMKTRNSKLQIRFNDSMLDHIELDRDEAIHLLQKVLKRTKIRTVQHVPSIDKFSTTIDPEKPIDSDWWNAALSFDGGQKLDLNTSLFEFSNICKQFGHKKFEEVSLKIETGLPKERLCCERILEEMPLIINAKHLMTRAPFKAFDRVPNITALLSIHSHPGLIKKLLESILTTGVPSKVRKLYLHAEETRFQPLFDEFKEQLDASRLLASYYKGDSASIDRQIDRFISLETGNRMFHWTLEHRVNESKTVTLISVEGIDQPDPKLTANLPLMSPTSWTK